MSAPAGRSRRAEDAPGVATTHLDNGLTVVTEAMPDVVSVALGFWVGVGGRDEAPAVAGASHFLEHLLFKGTDARSALAIAEAVDAVGGEMNAFTTKEYTAFHMRVLERDAGLALDVLSDIVWAPAFRPDEVEAERQVILEEILMHADEPADAVHDLFAAACFPAHPLGREVLGDEATIRATPRDAIRAFWAEHYRPRNLVVAAAGRLDHDEVVAGVARRLGAQVGGVAPERTPPSASPAPLAVVPEDTEQAHVVVGVRALARDDPDRYALSVVDQVLGGGLSSRLFQKVREERGLAYSVYSYRSSYADAGTLEVYAGTAPAHVAETLELVHAELDAMARAGISAHELELAVGHLTGSLALGLEDSGARMARIGRAQLVHGRVPPVDELVARIEAVTLEDVARVCEKVLAGSRALAVVGPFEPDDFADQRVA